MAPESSCRLEEHVKPDKAQIIDEKAAASAVVTVVVDGEEEGFEDAFFRAQAKAAQVLGSRQ